MGEMGVKVEADWEEKEFYKHVYKRQAQTPHSQTHKVNLMYKHCSFRYSKRELIPGIEDFQQQPKINNKHIWQTLLNSSSGGCGGGK